MKLATVLGLQASAIKGFGVSDATEFDVAAEGVRGDRDFFVIDEQDRLFSATRSGMFLPFQATWDETERRLTILRDDRLVISAVAEPTAPLVAHFYADRKCEGWSLSGPFDEWLSQTAGRPLRLIQSQQPSGGVDIEPFSLVSRASLAAVDVPGDTADTSARRFRLNMTVEAGDMPYLEETWAGGVVSVGGARLRLGGRVPRCAAVQRHPFTGEKDSPVLKRIFERRDRGPNGTLDLGVYAEVLEPGRIAVGDSLSLL
jgi:uncharacterized protein